MVYHSYHSKLYWYLPLENTKIRFSQKQLVKKFQFLQISIGTCINLTTVIVSTTDTFFAPSQASQTVCTNFTTIVKKKIAGKLQKGTYLQGNFFPPSAKIPWNQTCTSPKIECIFLSIKSSSSLNGCYVFLAKIPWNQIMQQNDHFT